MFRGENHLQGSLSLAPPEKTVSASVLIYDECLSGGWEATIRKVLSVKRTFLIYYYGKGETRKPETTRKLQKPLIAILFQLEGFFTKDRFISKRGSLALNFDTG